MTPPTLWPILRDPTHIAPLAFVHRAQHTRNLLTEGVLRVYTSLAPSQDHSYLTIGAPITRWFPALFCARHQYEDGPSW